MKKTEFRKLVKRLRKAFPPKIPVRVYYVSKKRVQKAYGSSEYDLFGLTVYDTEKEIISIYIAEDDHHQHVVDTLIEEWAHMLRYHLPTMAGDRDHDEIFGSIRNRIMQYLLGELGDDPSVRDASSA